MTTAAAASVMRASTLLYRNSSRASCRRCSAAASAAARISVPMRFLVGDRDPLFYEELVEEQAAHVDADYSGEVAERRRALRRG